jgi:hypothetical protein
MNKSLLVGQPWKTGGISCRTTLMRYCDRGQRGGESNEMLTEIEPIRGKIARILTSREVALNIGRNQGVTTEMLFDILFEVGVTDPDTGEELGPVELPKTRVKITRVSDKIAVASTYRTKRVNVGGTGTAISALFQPPKWETRRETLRVRESFEEIGDHIDEENSYVTVGDPVVQVLDAEARE